MYKKSDKDKNRSIDRRTFLKNAGVTGAAAVAASSVFAPSNAKAEAETYIWQMPTTWPKGQVC